MVLPPYQCTSVIFFSTVSLTTKVSFMKLIWYRVKIWPSSLLSNNARASLTTSAPLNLPLWSPPSVPASRSTNDHCGAPYGVLVSLLISVPVIFHQVGRSSEPTRSSNPLRRQLAHTTQTIKYLVVIHPKLVNKFWMWFTSVLYWHFV